MASIALMIGGAIINATTFVGGSYLAKYLSGSSDSDEEKKRHDLAVEKYQKEYEKYEETLADETGNLADLFARSEKYSKTNF